MSKQTAIKPHLFVVETESAKEAFNYTVTSYDLLLDLKTLMSEYYVATFDINGEKLILKFNNGQQFELKIDEVIA